MGRSGPRFAWSFPVTSQEGKKAVQASRVVGIDGPRWMLRATFLGTAITDAKTFARLVSVVRQTVIVRGDRPMAPGDVIALRAPQRTHHEPPPTTGTLAE